MRSSARALPSSPRREVPGKGLKPRGETRAARRPLQLELFGDGTPVRTPVRPTLLPAPSPDAARLALLRRLNRLASGRLCSLTLTDNRRTILSVRPGRPGDRTQLALRIHRSFLEAPEDVLRAVASFVESRNGSDRAREALAVIREHFSRHRPAPGARARRPVLRTEGTALDLRQVLDDLNQRYFDGRLSADITWGKAVAGAPGHRCRQRRTASLQLGSYSYEDRLIRVHRVLDQPSVPRYVIEAVVYHELLHADLPPVESHGRRYFHTPEFRRRERLFRHLDKANAWIQENLPDLLRARRGEAPRRPRRRA